jgi:hypothetical protein
VRISIHCNHTRQKSSVYNHAPLRTVRNRLYLPLSWHTNTSIHPQARPPTHSPFARIRTNIQIQALLDIKHGISNVTHQTPNPKDQTSTPKHQEIPTQNPIPPFPFRFDFEGAFSSAPPDVCASISFLACLFARLRVRLALRACFCEEVGGVGG